MKSSDRFLIFLIFILGLLGILVLVIILSKDSKGSKGSKRSKGSKKTSENLTNSRESRVAKRTVSFAGLNPDEKLYPDTTRLPYPETLTVNVEKPEEAPKVLKVETQEPFLIANVDSLENRTYGMSPGPGLMLEQNLQVGTGEHYPLKVQFVKDPQSHFQIMTPEGQYLQVQDDQVVVSAKPSTFGVYRTGLIQEANTGKYLRVSDEVLTASSAFGTPIRLVALT